jgi:hypothetical protein
MDSVPSYEFHEIFDRVTEYIDLYGIFTIEGMEVELQRAREKCRKHYRNAKNTWERARFKRAAVGYGRLLKHNFASRVLREARKNPDNIIGMTLRYGKTDAKRRIAAQKRAREEALLRRLR